MHRRAAVAIDATVIVALVALMSCTPSKVSRDGAVTVTGAVEDIDGKALPGAKVVLVKEADFGEVVLGATLFTGTLGTVCLVDSPPAICNKARTATTDGDGRYRFELKGSDTQGSVGNASTLYLSAGPPTGGASVSARFQAQRTEVQLPALRIWAPELKLSVARVARAEWADLEGARSERVVFTDGLTGEITWIAEGRSPVAIDARILEDSKGSAAVEAATSEEADGTTYRITHRSAEVPFTGSTGPAPSRGSACTPSPSSCPVTDGNFVPPSPPPPPASEVMIDLGVNRFPALINVRDCQTACNVETSLNRVDWTIVGSGDRQFFSITPVSGPPVHFVRITSTATDLNRLAEVSVWER
ncbi:MAG: hypothetical protein ACRD12_19330 [Acidimicrobiales bacterium]